MALEEQELAVSPLPGKVKSYYFLLHAKKKEREREREREQMKIVKETSVSRLNAPTVTT